MKILQGKLRHKNAALHRGGFHGQRAALILQDLPGEIEPHAGALGLPDDPAPSPVETAKDPVVFFFRDADALVLDLQPDKTAELLGPDPDRAARRGIFYGVVQEVEERFRRPFFIEKQGDIRKGFRFDGDMLCRRFVVDPVDGFYQNFRQGGPLGRWADHGGLQTGDVEQGSGEGFQFLKLEAAARQEFFGFCRSVRFQIEGKTGFQRAERRFDLMGDIRDKGFRVVLFFRESFCLQAEFLRKLHKGICEDILPGGEERFPLFQKAVVVVEAAFQKGQQFCFLRFLLFFPTIKRKKRDGRNRNKQYKKYTEKDGCILKIKAGISVFAVAVTGKEQFSGDPALFSLILQGIQKGRFRLGRRGDDAACQPLDSMQFAVGNMPGIEKEESDKNNGGCRLQDNMEDKNFFHGLLRFCLFLI